MSNYPVNLNQKFNLKYIVEIFTCFWKTIAWSIFILVISFLPGQTLEQMKIFDVRFQDLIVHFIIYAFLTTFIIMDKSRQNKHYLTTKVWWLFPLSISIILSILTETIQLLWIVGRYGNLFDFLFNMFGSVIAILLYRIIKAGII